MLRSALPLRGSGSLPTLSRQFSSTTIAANGEAAPARRVANTERRRPATPRRDAGASSPRKDGAARSNAPRTPRNDRPQATDRPRRRSVLSTSAPRDSLPAFTTADVTATLPDLSTDWSAAPLSSGAMASVKTYPYLTLGAPSSPSSTEGTTLARATFDAAFSNAQYEARRKEKKYRPLRTAERALRVHLGPSAPAPGAQVLGEEDSRSMPGETAVGDEGSSMGDAVKEARVRRERAVLEKLGGDYARYGADEVLKAAGGESDVEGAHKWVLRDAARAVAGVDRLDPVGKSWVVRAIKGEMR